MPKPYDPERVTAPHRNKLLRVMGSMYRQHANTQICPSSPRLDGKIALVTGGTRGIGAEIVSGMRERGADVIVVARSIPQTIERKPQDGVSFIAMDLNDLNSVYEAAASIEKLLNGNQIEILCANAGLSPSKHTTSDQGYESAFAVNCLGHHALIKLLVQSQTLSPQARIVGTTGDIYALTRECSADYSYRGRGILAYCRSKLGNIWQFQQLAKRYPELTVVLVHPGVVATELEGSNKGIAGAMKRMMMISPHLGAQASLIAATQPFASGTYFHNTRGVVKLAWDDAGLDSEKSDNFWKTLERLTSWLPRNL